MFINDRIIRAYLKNVYFINGTAYAGKSTIVKMISDRLGLRLCEENYAYDHFLSMSSIEEQPNMNYFKTMKDWKAFVSRSPEAYADWINGVSNEVAPFEIAELISISKHEIVIVDTNIPIEILKKIAPKDHVAILLTDTTQSVNSFFNREDPEKKFILEQINKTNNLEKTLLSFKKGLELINGQEVIEAYERSGFKCLYRQEGISLEDRFQEIVHHFGLEGS